MLHVQFTNRFPFISRKTKTLEEQEESLIKKCNKNYSELKRILTLAHYREYFLLKKELKNDLDNLKKHLEEESDTHKRILILQNMQEKLEYFNKNPFSFDSKRNNFAQKFLPFSEKTQAFLYSKGILL
jgi:hypothetical protein